jgi:hypothetical protein
MLAMTITKSKTFHPFLKNVGKFRSANIRMIISVRKIG